MLVSSCMLLRISDVGGSVASVEQDIWDDKADWADACARSGAESWSGTVNCNGIADWAYVKT